MPNLQSLDLSNNEITDLKPLLPILRNGLRISDEFCSADITVFDNVIINPPMSIVKKGGEAILSWFEQSKDEAKPDSDLLYKLKDTDLGINKMENHFSLDICSIENICFSQDVNCFQSDANPSAEAVNTVSVEIENILGETEMLKEDIEDERKILEKDIPKEDIDVTLKDIVKAETAIKEIKDTLKNSSSHKIKSMKRIERFMMDLSDEESTPYKVFKKLCKGRDYAVRLAEGYNKIAVYIGLTPVPSIALGVIYKL